jgi:hypothetical protein
MMDARSPWVSQNDARLKAQTRQLRITLEFRFGRPLRGEALDRELMIMGIDPSELYHDPVELGIRSDFTIEEEIHLKETTGKFPSSLFPSSCTREETQRRRQKYNAPIRAAQQAKRRAVKRARLAIAAGLDCRASALRTLLSAEWITMKELIKGLGRSPAFRRRDGAVALTGNSLKKAILRELKKPGLRREVETAKRQEKHGLTMYLFRLR